MKTGKIEVQGFLENERVAEQAFTEKGRGLEHHQLDGLKLTEIQFFATITSQGAMNLFITYLEIAKCCLPK